MAGHLAGSKRVVPSDDDFDDGDAATRIYHELNTAKFSWFHVKAILVAGVGFFTDAYDLFVITVAKPMIALVYYPELNGKLSYTDDLWVTGVALVGTLIGQILFGFLGDYLGRKKVYLVTLLLMICATIGQCFAASPVKGVGMITELCLWRFVLGIGIGGDYPLSATIASEYSSTKFRGSFISAIFAMQGLAILTGAIVAIATTAAFKSLILQDITNLDYVWRIIIGVGCVPALLTIYLRSTLPETPRFTVDVERNDTKALANMQAVKDNEYDHYKHDENEDIKLYRLSWSSLHRYLTHPNLLQNRNLWVLWGTCSTWFLLDIAYYSQNLFLPDVLEAIGYNPKIQLPISKLSCWKTHSCPRMPYPVPLFGPNIPACTGVCAELVYNKIFKTAAGNAIVACFGTVPGYWFTVGLADIMGRTTIQYMGFGMMTALLVVLAAGYDVIKHTSVWLFIVLYALTFFFANFGPNATTFVTPVELFTTKYRSTLHGLSAASGKAGAIVGAFGFGKMFLSLGLAKTLAALAATNFLGFVMTIFVPEANGMDLEESSLFSTSTFARLLELCGCHQVNPVVEDAAAELQAQLERENGSANGKDIQPV